MCFPEVSHLLQSTLGDKRTKNGMAGGGRRGLGSFWKQDGLCSHWQAWTCVHSGRTGGHYSLSIRSSDAARTPGRVSEKGGGVHWKAGHRLDIQRVPLCKSYQPFTFVRNNGENCVSAPASSPILRSREELVPLTTEGTSPGSESYSMRTVS